MELRNIFYGIGPETYVILKFKRDFLVRVLSGYLVSAFNSEEDAFCVDDRIKKSHTTLIPGLSVEENSTKKTFLCNDIITFFLGQTLFHENLRIMLFNALHFILLTNH